MEMRSEVIRQAGVGMVQKEGGREDVWGRRQSQLGAGTLISFYSKLSSYLKKEALRSYSKLKISLLFSLAWTGLNYLKLTNLRGNAVYSQNTARVQLKCILFDL